MRLVYYLTNMKLNLGKIYYWRPDLLEFALFPNYRPPFRKVKVLKVYQDSALIELVGTNTSLFAGQSFKLNVPKGTIVSAEQALLEAY